MLRHVVLIRFKPDTAPATIRAIETAFAGLESKIAAIEALSGASTAAPKARRRASRTAFS